MNVKALVGLHKQFTDIPQSISENIGDGFLCKHNKFYRKIRNLGLACGTDFIVKKNKFWNDYMVLPLVNFDDLLISRKIPVIDNFGTLARLSKKFPSLDLPEKFVRDTLKRNYLLHETCHCIANNVLTQTTVHIGSETEITNSKLTILLNNLLGEALANAVEIVSSTTADTNSHILLHALNSYVPYSPASNDLLKKAVDSIGMQAFLKLTFVSFFFNNLLGYEHSKTNLESILEKFGSHFKLHDDFSGRELVLEAILKCCRLNTRFRDETSTIYFSTLDLGDAYKILSAERVLHNQDIIDYIVWSANKLCDLILKDI
jgi:hypothetical protein